jgi:hypothetical protein
VRVPEHAGTSVAPQLFGHTGVGVGVLTQRIELSRTRIAGATGDRKGHDYSVAHRQISDPGTNLDDVSHELMTQDVALLHGRYVAVVEVQIRATDSSRGDLDNGIALIQDHRIRNVSDLDGITPHPTSGTHGELLSVCRRRGHRFSRTLLPLLFRVCAFGAAL